MISIQKLVIIFFTFSYSQVVSSIMLTKTFFLTYVIRSFGYTTDSLQCYQNYLSQCMQSLSHLFLSLMNPHELRVDRAVFWRGPLKISIQK